MENRFDPPQSVCSLTTVLVVDAKPLALLATAGVLHHDGFRCVCARTGDAAMTALGVSTSSVQSDHAQSDPNSDPIDLIVWDVGDDPNAVLSTLEIIRRSSRYRLLPAILIAQPQWAGLEQKTQGLLAATHCLFQPIDPRSLSTIASQLSWLPAVQSAHRTPGSRPMRPGWITL